MSVTTLVIRTAGTNCDAELVHAFHLAGADTTTLHLNQLLASPDLLGGFDLIGFPGGFSYGDDIAAGRIFANRLRHGLLGPLRDAIAGGAALIGICNGFQVLVKLGLLPDPHTAAQSATLADNAGGRFVDRWVSVTANPESPCIWTRGLDTFDLPIAHGEGRFTAPAPVLDRLEAQGQVALTYRSDINGSDRAIAGICDPTGRVFGLMPHPERYTAASHHPAWTRQAVLSPDSLDETPPGLRFFENAVAWASQPRAARATETVATS